jgi:hypothetical protein
MKLTQDYILKLELVPGKTDQIEWDDLPGFGARIRAGGMRTWVVQYRVEHKQRRQTIGKVKVLGADEARAEAKRVLAKVTLGGDPQGAK